MLKEVIFPQHRRFRSRTDWEPIGFFSEALCNSTQFDLKLGFFSSSAINVLADSFAIFLYRGGKMRLIINDILSSNDKQAFMVGESDETIPYFNLRNLEGLQHTFSERDQHFFDCLSWLIRNGRLEFKIVVPRGGVGIAHSKCGVFSDGLNRVAFDGSCNFSQTALISNIESITAFCDWDGGSDVYKIEDIAADFAVTFSGKDESVVYLPINQVKESIMRNAQQKEIKDLLDDEKKLLTQRIEKGFSFSPGIVKILERSRNEVYRLIESMEDTVSLPKTPHTDVPCFPYAEPREYQKQAFENWKANKQKGLFAMATGTGKTITSLNCLLEIYKRSGYYKAIILVPTITLVEQWEKECHKFNFQHIYKISSRNHTWKDDIAALKISERLSSLKSGNSYIIIATYASFAKKNIFDELNEFPRSQVLLIADEAHNLGSGQMKKRLPLVNYLRRIGLSATPDRQYDEEGNEAINNFFGVQGKYTFEYSMEEAIRNKVLCRYYYYPHVVRLTDVEMEEYVTLSEKIAKYIGATQEKSSKDDPVLTGLLLKRKRIIHKAANKKEVFRQILRKRFEEKHSLKYTLVYVPEGDEPEAKSDVYESHDATAIDSFTDNLMEQYTAIVSEVDEKVTVRKFTAISKDRDQIIEDFAAGRIDVLTSMKCLDEGVDVPRSELAIFCASTGNPRQFIQRRGRILRIHPDKHMAEIHDLVVAPQVDVYSPSFELEKRLLQGELKRVKNFALLSENSIDSVTELDDILSYYGISIFN